MKRLLSIFALLMAASMLIWIAGCAEEEEEEKGPAPSVKAVSVPEGATVASNASITVTFSKKVASATIMLNGTPVAATPDASGKVYTFSPGKAGDYKLTVEAEDDAGQALDPAFTPVSFKATEPDTTKPKIDDAKSDPKNGASGVDPSKYPEKLTIAFSEPMGEVKVTSKDPTFNSTEELSADGMTLAIKLLKFTFPNETRVTVELTGKDKAGNELETTKYSFETMKKEG